jgi:hypothetical protein
MSRCGYELACEARGDPGHAMRCRFGLLAVNMGDGEDVAYWESEIDALQSLIGPSDDVRVRVDAATWCAFHRPRIFFSCFLVDNSC